MIVDGFKQALVRHTRALFRNMFGSINS